MDVSIIIVNYNTKTITANCIDSIFKYTTGIQYEVIVVDNCSSDGSKELFENDHRITYIYSAENLGFGKANNLGVSKSSGRYILYLNSDTLLMNNAVALLVDFLEKNKGCGICGGNLFDVNNCPTHSYFRTYPSICRDLIKPLSNAVLRAVYRRNLYFNNTGNPLEVKHISGADLMIRRSIVEKYGGFNPEFFMYYEETELCYRIHKLGYTLYSVPSAKIQHLCGASDKLSQSIIWQAQSRYIYFRLIGKTKLYQKIDKSLRMCLLLMLIKRSKKDKSKHALLTSLYQSYTHIRI